MGGIAWIKQDAAIRLPVKVVDKHLFQIRIAGFTVADEFPFGIDNYLVPCRSSQNNVGFDPSTVPKHLGILIRNPIAVILEPSLQRAEDETLPEHVHIEEDGKHVFSASAEIRREIQQDQLGQTQGIFIMVKLSVDGNAIDRCRIDRWVRFKRREIG